MPIVIADHVTKDMTPEQAYNLGRGLAQKEHTYRHRPDGNLVYMVCKCGAGCRGIQSDVDNAQARHVEHEAEIMGKAFKAYVHNNSEENRDRI